MLNDRLMKKCNLCLYRMVQERARELGETVSLVDEPLDAFPEGKGVYKHPYHILDPILHDDRYFVFWAASIPDECKC